MLALHFFLTAVIALLLTATYLVAVFELEKNLPQSHLRKLAPFFDNPNLTSTWLN